MKKTSCEDCVYQKYINVYVFFFKCAFSIRNSACIGLFELIIYSIHRNGQNKPGTEIECKICMYRVRQYMYMYKTVVSF